jgi:peptide/nickel transport system permease protein
VSSVAVTGEVPALSTRRQRNILIRTWGSGRARVGLIGLVLITLLALLGPVFAPHSPTEFVGIPYCHPNGVALAGCDNLGRDVLSRFLYGGRTVLGLSLAATILGVGGGVAVGLCAAYARGGLDDLLMRAMDVLMAFPPMIFALLVVSMLGSQIWLLIVTVALAHLPRVARVARGAALEVLERDYILQSRALGEPGYRVLLREVLPNVSSPLLVEASMRLTSSVAIMASLSFLGLGLQPPAADWGLMINENRTGLTLEPWGVILPIATIALLTIFASLFADGLSRTLLGIERPVEQTHD